MISSPGSSFIPKQENTAVPASVRRRRTFSVFHFIATIALLASVMLAGGTYFYKHQQIKYQEELKVQLKTIRDALSEDDVFSVQNFDRKLQAAQFLLDNHLAPSKIFAALEQQTLQRVQFDSFKYEHTLGEEPKLTLTGATTEFSTLALQGLAFSENDISEAVVVKTVESSADESASGDKVLFSFDGHIADAAIAYTGSPTAPPAATVDTPVALPDAAASQGIDAPSDTPEFDRVQVDERDETSNVSN